MKTRVPKVLVWSGFAADAAAFFEGCLGGNVPAAAVAPAQPVAKAEVVVKKAPVAKAKPADKPCSKVQRGMSWEFSHYKKKDGDIIVAEDDAQPGMSFNFYNCENIKVVIPGKIKSVLLSRCKKIDLKFDETIAMVEVIRSDECKLRIMVGNKRVEAQHCQ